jgi:cbb3-type cytochrome oxidase subunit 3
MKLNTIQKAVISLASFLVATGTDWFIHLQHQHVSTQAVLAQLDSHGSDLTSGSFWDYSTLFITIFFLCFNAFIWTRQRKKHLSLEEKMEFFNNAVNQQSDEREKEIS